MRKNQHFTLVRNVQSFDNLYFEILLYFNRDLQRLINVNQQRITSYFSSQFFNRSENLNIFFESNINIIKTQQFKIFIQVKRCVVVSLKIDDNIQINFEIRIKYRMFLKEYRNRIMTFFFNIFDLWVFWKQSNNENEEISFFFTTIFKFHRFYWILFTFQMNRFQFTQINCYFLSLEIIIIQCLQKFNELILNSEQKQHRYAMMTNAFVRIIQFIMNDIFST